MFSLIATVNYELSVESMTIVVYGLGKIIGYYGIFLSFPQPFLDSESLEQLSAVMATQTVGKR